MGEKKVSHFLFTDARGFRLLNPAGSILFGSPYLASSPQVRHYFPRGVQGVEDYAYHHHEQSSKASPDSVAEISRLQGVGT